MSKVLLSYLFKTNLAIFRSAILEENTDKICRVLDFERDLLTKDIDNEGNTALLLAVEHSTPIIVRLLLDHGAVPDQTNTINLRTPLGILASKVYDDYQSHKAQKTLEMAKILLEYGAYVDKPIPYIYKDEASADYSGKETPLMIAVRKGNLPLVKLLIGKKANVNYVERQSGVRPIHYAISNGDEKMFDLLDTAGALTPSIVMTGDNTLLHWFCYRKENDAHISILEKLIQKGFDINAQNLQQRTPLMVAVRNDMTNVCRVLIQNNADIDKCDYNGNKAIDLSILGSECWKILLHITQTEKYKLRLRDNPVDKPRNTIIRKQKLDLTRRRTTELSDINNTTETRSEASTSSEDKVKDSPILSSNHTNKIIKNENENENENSWRSSFRNKRKQLLSNKFRKQRALSVDTENATRL
ncbi:unnamed protein product [Adineta ricciae]|uniref:Uncharacterized protein n=1 Tax=Adineta ricciae TaxID=249248 RepID=A0A815P0B2_ADIRI|nr:unnamed protein product [Adineta ricciae]CAF1441382.1 unnamed protein product [Adineta ricciae]